jgi:hypothetical protein
MLRVPSMHGVVLVAEGHMVLLERISRRQQSECEATKAHS